MDEVVRVEIAVDAEAAEALKDDAFRDRVGRLINQLASFRHGRDPLSSLLERISGRAQAAGLTDEDVEAELAAIKTERRG